MKSKIVFMFGGGIDSVAQVILLNNLLSTSTTTPQICLLHINYGQIARSKEIEAGVKLVEFNYASDIYSIDTHKILNTSNPLFTKFSGGYDKSKCMVEFRNAMLGVVGLFTILNDERFSDYKDADVCFGFYSYKGLNTFPFPDETNDFIDKMNGLVEVYGYTNRFMAPFIGMSKSEIWKKAYEIEPNLFSISWTCYEDDSKQCGKCPHCIYLKEFMKNELNLPEHKIKEMFIA